MEQLRATLSAARRATRASRVQLAICYALLVVGLLLGARGTILGGVVFFVGVFGTRVASRDLRRHRAVIREIEERLQRDGTAAVEDKDDR